MLGEALAVFGGKLAELPIEELEMDVEGVERIADLMGDSSGEKR